jgi:DGQHR domain-containing protein
MSTLSQIKIEALTNIPVPSHLRLDVKPDYDALMKEIGRRSVGFNGVPLFGCAFVQGGRLQFTTAMPVKTMLEVSDMHRAKKGSNVKEVLEHSNRHREPAHEKKIADYLSKTACVGEKFILPSFTFNFGSITEDHTPDVSLILLDNGHDGSTTWPAVLLLPHGAKLETTDGAHRRNTINDMIYNNKKLNDENRDLLLCNAVDAKLVFESSAVDSHQDFADCGRTKPISNSQLAAYDARDSRNHIATKLATTHPFMSEFVDGGSNNVNLTAKSHRVWSLAAVRTMIQHIVDNHPSAKTNPESKLSDDLKTQNLGAFIDELVKSLPSFKALEANRKDKIKDPTTESVTGTLREHSGGNVALRAIGMFIFARAFVYCLEHNIPFKPMAEALATLDWHALDCARDAVPASDDPDEYSAAVMSHVNPIWRPLIVIKAKRYKISSSNDDANTSWDIITNQLFPAKAQAAE